MLQSMPLAGVRDRAAIMADLPLAGVRDRAAVMADLRRLLPGIGSFSHKTLPFGVDAIDRHLPEGGLSCGALHEVVPQPHATPAAFGFIAALLGRLMSPPQVFPSPEGRVFVVMPGYGLRQYGRPYGHGLAGLGLDPARLILVATAHRKQTLWAIEQVLHSGAPAAVAGAIDRLDLKVSQRLQLAASDQDCRFCCCVRRPRRTGSRARQAPRQHAGASGRPPPRATASA